MLDNANSAFTLVVANQHRDRVERIEKKMRIKLRLQRGEARARKLFRESRNLQFALARLEEIARGMFDTDDAKINGCTERQRDEDPAQPFNTKLSPELCCSGLHRSLKNLPIEDQNEHESQDLTACGPSYAEQDGKQQMRDYSPGVIRARQRPSFGDREDERCEKRIQKPIATLEQEIA